MEKERKEVEVSGVGRSKEEAFAHALSKVQKEVQSTHEVLLRIKPLNVVVLSAKEKVWTEKFLFFFLPREKREYEIVLRVEVENLGIATKDVYFEKCQVRSPEKLPIPRMNRRGVD